MRISVVSSLYNSAEFIPELHRRLCETLERITDDYEIILVNDGSPDASLAVALEIIEKGQSHLKLIDLARNCGQHKALITGLKHATGDIIFMMDSDLEEEPEWIELFWAEYQKSKAEVDVIYGVQSTRRGKLYERLSGRTFYKVFNLLSSVKVQNNPTPFRLMTRRYVDALIQFKEQEVFFLGISLLAGFEQRSIQVEKHNSSSTTYNIIKKIDQFINAITSFSKRPLMFVFYLGAIISLLSFIFLLVILAQYLFFGIGVEGWTSLIVSIWLVGGIMIFCTGIIGIYLSKIFIEVKNRPYSIIKKVYE
jgi:putative glycosyltransferase